MGEAGYLYVLVNPSMAGLVKVGRTARDPEARARELSATTGVPSPFMVAYEAYFTDCVRAEGFVHAYLQTKNYRVSANREFFQAPLKEVITSVLAAQSEIAKPSPQVPLNLTQPTPEAVETLYKQATRGVDVDERFAESLDSVPVWKSVFDMAQSAELGLGTSFRNLRQALTLYKQAARLGCAEAYREIGEIYLGENFYPEEGLRNPTLALEYLQEGARLGEGNCYPLMASVFQELGQIDQVQKAWTKYAECIWKPQYDKVVYPGKAIRTWHGLSKSLVRWTTSQRPGLCTSPYPRLNRITFSKTTPPST